MALFSPLRSWYRSTSWTTDTQATDQEEAFLSDKPNTQTEPENEISPQELQLQTSYRRLKHSFTIVALFLGCVIVVLAMPWHRDGARPKSAVPEMPMSRVKFEQDQRFAAASSLESDDAWSAMMPPGDGFVVIDGARKFNLPPGKSSPYGELYDVSMWHQLHCLSHMRTYLYTMQSHLNRTNVQQVFDVVLKPQSDHILHCFDYLRQAIMCAGDMTLEWPRTEADGRRFAVDGWGVEHQCKDWDAMAGFVERHAVGRHHHHDGQL